MRCFKSVLAFFILFLSKVRAELNGCNEIVITDCDRKYCNGQNEVNFPSAEFCQLTCQFMAGNDSCQSWAYHNNEKLCDLYRCQLSEWVPTCKQLGGPVNVNLEACLQQDSGCEAFKRGHCNFQEENVLANIAGNFRAEDCQVLCTQFPGCVFFHTEEHFCSLFSASVAECDSVSGPPVPEQTFCKEITTTTPSPEATTTTPLPETCEFTINNETTLHDSYVFEKIETTTIKFALASNLACQATFVAVGGGGGGYSGVYHGGGGSGYIENVIINISSTEYEVTVGNSYGPSYVINNAGENIIYAHQGGNGNDIYKGGDGYSGGGGEWSNGGSNGSDGEGREGEEYGGRGSGTNITEVSMDHFVLSPGDWGEPNGSYGGGGGGILVDNFGPNTNDYDGKGYGAGGGKNTLGHPGLVLIEVKPK